MYCAGLDHDVWFERWRRMWDYLLNVEGYCLSEDCMVKLASLHLSHVSRFFMEKFLIEAKSLMHGSRCSWYYTD